MTPNEKSALATLLIGFRVAMYVAQFLILYHVFILGIESRSTLLNVFSAYVCLASAGFFIDRGIKKLHLDIERTENASRQE